MYGKRNAISPGFCQRQKLQKGALYETQKTHSPMPILRTAVRPAAAARDVPEIMPQQSYRAAEEASAQAHTAEVFQSAPASVSYPLTDTSTVLTLSYPLNNDFDLAGDQQFLAAWEKTTGVTIDAEAVPGAEYYANLNQRIAADELSDIYLHLPGLFVECGR